MVEGTPSFHNRKGPHAQQVSVFALVRFAFASVMDAPLFRSSSESGCGPPVAEGDAGPPGPIPNPVVKRISASGYCGSNAVGDAAAAGRPRLIAQRWLSFAVASRGGAAAARRAHNPKVGGSNPPPATSGHIESVAYPLG